MNIHRVFSSLAVCCLAAILMLGPGAAGAASDHAAAADDIAAIRERIQSLIGVLSDYQTLNRRQTGEIRDELEAVYADLRSIEQGLGSSVQHPQPGNSQWELYRKAEVDVLPRNASFNGWKSGNSMIIRIGGDEDIYLTVTNGTYTAETYIPDAYKGSVKTKAVADPGGWVILEVADGHGSREFKIENGGLGPVYMRGSGGGKSVSPVNPGGDYTGTAPSGKWDAKYVSLVHSGQLDQAASMDWLRGQVKDREYASDALRDLGEYLRLMEGESAHDRIGVLRYFSGNTEKHLDIADPRVDALAFVNLMNKVYALDSAQDWYRIDMD